MFSQAYVISGELWVAGPKEIFDNILQIIRFYQIKIAGKQI